MKAIDVAGLHVRRGARDVVRDASFAADRGDIVALMGASGSGKTSVLRAVAGLDPIAAGTITIDDVHVDASRPLRADVRRLLHRRVGMVFQFHHLFAHLTALHNVWLAPVHVLRQPREDAQSRARVLLDQLGVGHRADALPHELSGGEAQRVAIARAMAVGPPVLLMDEPTASLDPERRGELAATLRELAAGGTTLVVATHDLDFVESCSCRVVRMEAGRIVSAGSSDPA
jgi:ABC-type polar amino acid transport system ATPase subunit